jgi:hypothetical protein
MRTLNRPLVAGTLLAATFSVAAEPPAAPPAGAPLTAAAATALATRIASEVEALRGAKFKKPVPVKVIDDAVARRYFESRLGKLLPRARLTAEASMYQLLGLVPPGTDLDKILFDLLEEQAGGFYDPESETFFVLSDMPAAVGPILVAHELTHALDDQAYQIDTMLAGVLGDGDRENALSSVIEGSGTVVMTAFMFQEMKAGRMAYDALLEMQKTEAGRAEKLNAAPPVLQRSLLGPYVLGASFLLRGSLAGFLEKVPAADLDRAFRQPPASTEQILHPEKYWGPGEPDLPRPVPLPDLSSTLGGGWTRLGEGTLGEMIVALLTGSAAIEPMSLEAALPSSWTNDAATGWGGDRWALFGRGPQRILVLGTIWDTEQDAIEFAAALKLPAGAKVERRGAAVALVAGDISGRGERLLGETLAALAPAPSVPGGSDEPPRAGTRCPARGGVSLAQFCGGCGDGSPVVPVEATCSSAGAGVTASSRARLRAAGESSGSSAIPRR